MIKNSLMTELLAKLAKMPKSIPLKELVSMGVFSSTQQARLLRVSGKGPDWMAPGPKTMIYDRDSVVAWVKSWPASVIRQ